MNIPTEIVFSRLKGGWFECCGRFSGVWWREGKKVAEWRRVDGRAVVTWL